MCFYFLSIFCAILLLHNALLNSYSAAKLHKLEPQKNKKTKRKQTNKTSKNKIRAKQINRFFLRIKVKYILLLLVATSAHWMFDLYIYIYIKHHPKFPFRSGIFLCYQLFFEKPEKIGSFDYGIKTQRCLYLYLNLCCHPVNMINTACFTDDVFKEANSKGICKILLPSTSICEQNLLK